MNITRSSRAPIESAPSSVIEFKDVSYRYGAAKIPALRNISFRIERESFTGLVGPNGGGKTSLLQLALGLLKPTSGEVFLFGRAPEKARSRVGYVPQGLDLNRSLPITALDVVALGADGALSPSFFAPRRRRDRIEKARAAMRLFNVDHLRSRRLDRLSGGEIQRALIARAIVSDPDLLIMDEPTANVDERGEKSLFEILNALRAERGVSIVVVSHDIGFISSHVTAVACLNRDLVFHSTAPTSGELIERLYAEMGPVESIMHDCDISQNH